MTFVAKEIQVDVPDVATTLNNIACDHIELNEFPQALEKYEESLKIRRELAKENPLLFEIDYASALVFGVSFFEKDSNDLKEAKRILEKYKQVPNAVNLLNIINDLEKE